MSNPQVQDAVREKYGEIARSVGQTGCCGPSNCGCGDPISSDLYSAAETAGLPGDAVAVSLGCGNPTALIDLQPGQTVLDLGSGGGIDVLLSAKRVGPAGKVYGLDMTDDMLALARENQRPFRRLRRRVPWRRAGGDPPQPGALGGMRGRRAWRGRVRGKVESRRIRGCRSRPLAHLSDRRCPCVPR